MAEWQLAACPVISEAVMAEVWQDEQVIQEQCINMRLLSCGTSCGGGGGAS